MDAQLTFFSPIDGVRLYYEWWMPPSPKAILVVVHGVGEHSGRYGPLLRYFGERGFGLAIYDQRGHGHSSGRRGHVEHFQDLLGDLAHFVQMLRERYPAVPLFLVGHSLGGQVVLNFVVRYAKGLRGIVCSSPSVQLAVPVRSWKQRLIQTMYRWVPTARVGQQIRAEDLSHDPEVVRRDPAQHGVGNGNGLADPSADVFPGGGGGLPV
ncbi:MAG: alpha/beta fold hydrolase [Deltaproteobacteria bacterium]|nr:alpha/beta fold hydrolase [Deltaproteobacteria bacterium]